MNLLKSSIKVIDETVLLRMEISFSDCGEWGGNKEEILISRTENEDLYLTHKMYEANCEQPDFVSGKNGGMEVKTVLTDSVKIKMSKFEKALICDFSSNLVSAKLYEDRFDIDCEHIQLMTYNERGEVILNIDYQGCESLLLNKYVEFIDQLGL